MSNSMTGQDYSTQSIKGCIENGNQAWFGWVAWDVSFLVGGIAVFFVVLFKE